MATVQIPGFDKITINGDNILNSLYWLFVLFIIFHSQVLVELIHRPASVPIPTNNNYFGNNCCNCSCVGCANTGGPTTTANNNTTTTKSAAPDAAEARAGPKERMSPVESKRASMSSTTSSGLRATTRSTTRGEGGIQRSGNASPAGGPRAIAKILEEGTGAILPQWRTTGP